MKFADINHPIAHSVHMLPVYMAGGLNPDIPFVFHIFLDPDRVFSCGAPVSFAQTHPSFFAAIAPRLECGLHSVFTLGVEGW